MGQRARNQASVSAKNNQQITTNAQIVSPTLSLLRIFRKTEKCFENYHNLSGLHLYYAQFLRYQFKPVLAGFPQNLHHILSVLMVLYLRIQLPFIHVGNIWWCDNVRPLTTPVK